MAYDFHPDAKLLLTMTILAARWGTHFLPKLNALSVVLNSFQKHGLNYQRIQDADA